MATGDDVGEFPGVVFPFPDEGDVVGLESLGVEVEVDVGVEVVVGVVADVGVGVVDVVDTVGVEGSAIGIEVVVIEVVDEETEVVVVEETEVEEVEETE